MLRLTPEQRRDLRVLYLAPFAPERGRPCPEPHPTVGMRSIYHWEICDILEQLGVLSDSCNDLDRFPALARQADFVFSLYSRAAFRNCEVYVPAICARLGVPVLGAPPNVRALAEDKHYTKVVMAQAGVPVAPGRAYARACDIPAEPPFPGPYFVKYRFGSASEDVSLDSACDSWAAAAERARASLDQGKEPVVERLLPGYDITVPVLGGDQPMVLPPVAEWSDLPHGIATFEQKRFLTGDRRRGPVEDAALAARVGELARRVAAELQPFDYMRVDFRCDTGGELWFLETNIACNIGSTAAIVYSAEQVGRSQADLVEHVLAHSLGRQPRLPWRTENI